MDAFAGERVQQLGQQLAHQGERFGLGRVERGRSPHPPPVVRPPIGCDRERPVAVVLQPALHVAETVAVGHELHMAGATEPVEVAHLRGGEGRRGGPHLLVVAVGERVLHVEVDLVHLPRRQAGDQLPQGRGCGHLVTRDVQHHAPHREVGPVVDGAHRQHPLVQAGQLRERGSRVERAGLVGGVDVDTSNADRQPIALPGQRVVDPHDRLTGRDAPVVELDRAGSGQQVHRSFLRYTKNTADTTAPMRA